MKPIQRALISVSDKTGVVEFAQTLAGRGVEILSTGGTAGALREAGVAVREVSDYTGFPEIMDGRVKTLHPRIHGGILARRDQDTDAMTQHDIAPIDLVVVNLYPFERTVVRSDCTRAQAIENIDIGGPSLLRAGAKNHAWVTVVVDPGDYASVAEAMSAHNGAIPEALRARLAAKAFAHTAHYDQAIAAYLIADTASFPAVLQLQFVRKQEMRYGENPHQAAALYAEMAQAPGTVVGATQVQGKAISYNNVADADTALECVMAFQEPACVIVKHANPCGAAIADTPRAAYERAYQTDPTSAFGGIIAFNRALDAETAEAILSRQFVEVILAPEIEPDAGPVLAEKKNVRVLVTGALLEEPERALDFKRVRGGLLAQERDTARIPDHALKVVTRRSPTDAQWHDLRFAWNVVKFVKSNAIVYVRDRQTLGVGAGQMSRVISARIAALKAQEEGLSLEGAVMASDAFFPFRDGIDAAAEAGIRAVIQPGGSVRDPEVIAAADEHGIAMVCTGMRHFRH